MILLSGGFDPIHVGHVRMIEEARRKYRTTVVVALNSDDWLMRKKGYVFMPWQDRCEILRAMNVVVYKVNDEDGTVCDALLALKPAYFGNGGDRIEPNSNEHKMCELLGIKEVFGLGGAKVRSSSSIVSAAHLRLTAKRETTEKQSA